MQAPDSNDTRFNFADQNCVRSPAKMMIWVLTVKDDRFRQIVILNVYNIQLSKCLLLAS